MSNLRPFQILLLAIFGILAVVSIMLLSGFSPTTPQEDRPYGDRVVIWGTLDAGVFNSVINDLESGNKGLEVVEYFQFDPRKFNDEFVNAVAEGRSPDLLLLPSSELVNNRNKLLSLSSESVSPRDFKDSYVDGAEIFARNDGVYALPLAVDPIVMYWNRDMFSSNGLAQAPTTWEYVVSTVVPTLTQKNNNRDIEQSAIAFGEVNNVKNAKEILLMLTMQSGSKMIYENEGRYMVELNSSISSNLLPPFETAVQFFINFSNSNNRLYSWNRSLSLDRNTFIAGDLGMYFGYGSENKLIKSQNPNLNFDVAPVPQGATATIRRTFGEFYGFAIPKTSPNTNGAFRAANFLVRPDVSAVLTEGLGLASAQRSVIAAGSRDAFRQVILKSALIARSWLDPQKEDTVVVFKNMIEDISSGRKTLNTSIGDTINKIKLVF